MLRLFATIVILTTGHSAYAQGCPDQALTYDGVWLDKGAPTAAYRLTLPNAEKGSIGCYWIGQTPEWGISQDITLQARVENPNLEGGVLIAIDQAWVWIPLEGMTRTSFQEMWFNRNTKGIPR